MFIQVPTKAGGTVDKLVEVGCGIKVEVYGTHYSATLEVLEVNEDEQTARAKSAGYEAWFTANEIRDALSPGQFAVEKAIHVSDIGG